MTAPAADSATTATRPKTVFVMPFSHLDLLWLGNREECVSRGCRVFQEAVRICEMEPGFRFMIEDGVFLEQFLLLRPDWKPRLVELIRVGRIEPPAKWCTITQSNVDGEVLGRNFLYGLRYTQELGAERPRALHLGDLPAHPSSLPRVMRHAGFESLVISRGGPMTVPLFRWRSSDDAIDAEVVCWHAPYCYNWGLPLGESCGAFNAEHAERVAKEVAVMAGRSASHVFMHYGWDLSVPTDAALDNLANWNRTYDTPLCWSTQAEFFDAVRDEPDIPVFHGEMPTVWGNWPDTAYLDVTIHHDEAVSALLLAERLTAIAAVRGETPSATTLERWWKLLLESLDHNYSAVATEETHARKNRLTHAVTEAATRHARHHLSRVAASVPREGDDVPVVVFNPTSHRRSETVYARAVLYGDAQALTPASRKTFHLVDRRGVAVPMDICELRVSAADQLDFAFAARDVPGMGHDTYYIRFGEPRLAPQPSTNSRIDIDGQTGEIRLLDADERPLATLCFRAVEQQPGNQIMQLTETGRVFPLLVETVGEPVSTALREIRHIRGEIAGTPVSLEATFDRVAETHDVAATIEHAGAGYLRFQLLIRPEGGVDPASLVIGNPFGSNAFDALVPGCAPARDDEVLPDTYGRTREAQGWFLMQGKDQPRALAVATQRRLIEHRDDGIAVNLLSSMSAKWIKPAEVFHPFVGTYPSRLRFHTVAPNDRAAAARLAQTLWHPMPVTCDYSGGGVTPDEPSHAAIAVHPDHVSLSAFKIADDGDGVIVRVVETAGNPCSASVAVRGIDGPVFETDLVETTGAQIDPARIELGAFEIKTLRFTGPRVEINRLD